MDTERTMGTRQSGGITRRQLIAAGTAAFGTAVAGCSQVTGGSGPCAALKREMKLLVNKDYEQAAKFVPYRKISRVSKEEAEEWQRLQRGLLFGDLDVTLDNMECACEYELEGDELQRVQTTLKRNRPIEADIKEMVLVQFSITISHQGESGSDEMLALVYSFGEGNWYTMGSRPAIARAAAISDCDV